MVQLNLSLRTPLQPQHLVSKYGRKIFYIQIKILIYSLCNKKPSW